MTEQCAIYLDPWDKTDLEGTAMLVGRMPDITDRTYRGVTCQRWFVRFLPDQDIVFRWLDYADAEPYFFPYDAPHTFSFGLPELTIDEHSDPRTYPYVHGVHAKFELPSGNSGYHMPTATWLRGWSILYRTTAASGGSNLTRIIIRREYTTITQPTLTKSTTVGWPNRQAKVIVPPRDIPINSALSIAFGPAQPAGESITLEDIIVTLFCSWQT